MLPAYSVDPVAAQVEEHPLDRMAAGLSLSPEAQQVQASTCYITAALAGARLVAMEETYLGHLDRAA